MNATQSIRVNGRDYTVTTQPSVGGVQYILTGKRGAVYGTMRNKNRPHMMFLIDCRGFGMVGKTPIWLSDETGSLVAL